MLPRPYPNFADRFVLGTAQFGLDYGIANRKGKLSRDSVLRIVSSAIENNLYYFDTARDYGDAERFLGAAFRSLGVVDHVKVFSKLPADLEGADVATIREAIQLSLNQLGLASLEGLLLRSRSFLKFWEDKYSSLMAALKQEGWVRHVGVSIYNEEEFGKAVVTDAIDFIQVPFNVFDRRGIRHSWFDRGEKAGKRLFVRSVYLQGLLLTDPSRLPPALERAKPFLSAYRRYCQNRKMSCREAALYFALQKSGKASMIIGVETVEQLTENVKLLRFFLDNPPGPEISYASPNVPEEIFNPSKWEIHG